MAEQKQKRNTAAIAGDLKGVRSGDKVSYPMLHDTDWLYKVAVEEQRTYKEIADMAGCSVSLAWNRIKKLGWMDKRRAQAWKPSILQDRQWLYKVAVEEQRTYKEIADMAGCSATFAGIQIKKLGWNKRRARPCKYPLLDDRQWLYKVAVEELRTYQEIADMAGCSDSVVQYRIKKLGWTEKRRAQPCKYPLLHDADWLYKVAVEEQRTLREIADMAGGCSRERVRQRIKKSGWLDKRQRRRIRKRSKQG